MLGEFVQAFPAGVEPLPDAFLPRQGDCVFLGLAPAGTSCPPSRQSHRGSSNSLLLLLLLSRRGTGDSPEEKRVEQDVEEDGGDSPEAGDDAAVEQGGDADSRHCVAGSQSVA